VLRDWRDTQLEVLLAEHELAGVPERDFPNDGWSGARLTVLEHARRRFVLKRTSWATDWIARATSDRQLREGWVAANDLFPVPPVEAPYLGAAADGDALAVLMPDLSAELIAWERPSHARALDAAQLDRVVDAIGTMHLWTWGDGIPGCPIEERVLLLSRPSAERYRAAGLPVGDRFPPGGTRSTGVRAPLRGRSCRTSPATQPPSSRPLPACLQPISTAISSSPTSRSWMRIG